MTPSRPETGDGLRWRKARRSIGNGACVEVAVSLGGKILVRDSTDRKSLEMQYPERSWRAFVISAQKGRFDLNYL
jgi:hypothetical protein